MANRFSNIVNKSISNIVLDGLNGKYAIKVNRGKESNLFGDGVNVLLGEERVRSSDPQERNVVTMTPRSSILIKKKAFSTLNHVNDLQWMDRTEKMLLRATKALFAYKVAQIRAYESLTEFEDNFANTSEINLSLLIEIFHNAKYLSLNVDESLEGVPALIDRIATNLAEAGYDDLKEEVFNLLKRNAFSSNLNLTTWIVDPTNLENYGTGPGTGVIELGMFGQFSTQTDLNTNPSSASFALEDPYRIMNITEGDIEIAIEEALVGTIGLLSELSNPEAPPIDTRSIVGAGMEVLGLGGLDSSLNVDYIRDRLRIFYLGKSIINPGDGVHFFIRGNKTVDNFSDEENSFDRDFITVDDSIFEAERRLFTRGKLDLETYKRIRQYADDSFGMRHVFGGFITQTNESWNNGRWVLNADCIDNAGWLRWSRFMIEPAIQDPQGILEDPLTPYEIKKDAQGRVDTIGGPQLLEENKQLIRSGLLFYDSGLLNGQPATENNLLQGQFNKTGSLNGAKILQHPHGLIYRWKEGIYSATAGINVTDPLDENSITQKLHNQAYGLTVAADVLNNLDVANILSLLIVGQPYNVESFINQAYQVHNISKRSPELNQIDPLSSVIDVIRRQNVRFGHFKPYRMITMSNQSLLQSANYSTVRTELNKTISRLQGRRAELDSLIRDLELSEAANRGAGPAQYTNNILINTLRVERETINQGIQDQLARMSESGSLNASEIVTQNFNLFGRNKSLPLTGNFEADHEVTRAMSIVGAQRRIEDVRLNQDQNLFIISDQYEEQTDIRPFIFALRNSQYKIFKGSFVSVYDKCERVANMINFELFCNSQGHLEFRPPQWNKTPLSVLNRMLEYNATTGKNIVPEFLTDVFQTRSDTLTREILSLNIRLVILCLLLNTYPDSSVIPNFPSLSNILLTSGADSGKKVLRFFGVRLSESSQDDSSLGLRDRSRRTNISLSPLARQGIALDFSLDNKKVINGDTDTLLGDFDPVFQEKSGFTENVLSVANGNSKTVKPLDVANASNLNKLRESFVKISGIDPAADLVTDDGRFSETDFIFYRGSQNSTTNNISKTKNYLDKLQQTISKRDNLVTILRRNKDKAKELEEVEEILSGDILESDIETVERVFGGDNSFDTFIRGLSEVTSGINATAEAITDIFTGDANRGTLFDHLVSDDTRNLTGPGSGRRYIVEDHDIISCTFSEVPPDFCRIDVMGDAPIIGNINKSFEDRYFWAGATDFDLWRQYGYKSLGSPRTLPFASSAEQVCKPYAILELQLQRVKINSAQITVVGNEYYEPGDTVYMPTKGLLYYVRSVSHSFGYGGSFTTSLTLEFGHPPGTYLPSPLEVIGQQYIKDPFVGETLTYRNQDGDDSYRVLQPDSSLVFPRNREISEANISVLLNHKDNAVRFTNMMADLSSLSLGNRKILLRGFVRGGGNAEEEARVTNNLRIIKYLLQNPSQLRETNNVNILDALTEPAEELANSLGFAVGDEKDTQPMQLPNGLPLLSINAEDIIEQIVFLEGNNSKNSITCLNPSSISAQLEDGKKISTSDYEALFPRGGPKQRTWLDIRDLNSEGFSSTINFDVSNVIEIGILDVEREISTGIKNTSNLEESKNRI